MDAPQSKSEWTTDRILAAFGIASIPVTFVLDSLDVLDDPRARWSTWFIAATLFTLACIRSKDERAAFLREGRSTRRFWYFVGAVAFVAVLVADVLVVELREPIKHSGMNAFQGNESGYTSRGADNPLVLHDVANVVSIDPILDSPFEGPVADMLFQKRVGTEQLLIHECRVVVTKFEKMPPYLTYGGALGEVDAIRVAFMLKHRSDPLPWIFRPTDVALNQQEVTLPLLIDDFAPNILRYYVNAGDPGIYWITCIVVVSDGVGPHKELTLTNKPIPLAFFIDTTQQSRPTEEQALKSKDWIPFPTISPAARTERLQELESASAPAAPVDGGVPFTPRK